MSDLTSEEQDKRVEEARRHYEESIPYVDEDQVNQAVESGDVKVRDLEKNVPTSLRGIWEELKTLLAMMRDYVTGRYRKVPFRTIAAIAAAILYFASPIDAIPDLIPIVGFIDDASVIALCLRMVHQDLVLYRAWRKSQEDSPAEVHKD